MKNIKHNSEFEKTVYTKSEQQLNDIINHLPDATFAINNEGKVIKWNKILEEMTGVKESEIIGKGDFEYALCGYGVRRPVLIDMIFKTDEEIRKYKYSNMSRSGNSIMAETKSSKFNDRNIILWCKASPLYNEYGELIGAIESMRDVTENKKIEYALKESEHRFKDLFNHMGSGVAIFESINAGEDFELMDINHAGVIMFNVSKDDVIGKNLIEVLPGAGKFGLLNVIKRVWRTGKPEYLPASRYQDQRLNFWVDNYIYKLSSGEVVMVFDNITRRKQAEDALRESERKYRDLVELLPLSVFETDEKGNYAFANPAAFETFGYTTEDIESGINIMQVVIPEDQVRFMENFGRVIDGEKLGGIEYMVKKKDGSIHPIIVHADPIIHNNKFKGLRGVIVDISELKETENKLKASVKEKEMLIKEIHHRVKNNMQIISSLLSLQKQYVNDNEFSELLQESQNRVKSMSIIHEKLYQSNDLIHINVSEYIKGLVLDLFNSYNIKKERIKLTIDVEAVSMGIETAVPCGLIISELISNSLKYAFPEEVQGEVYVGLKTLNDNGKYELKISDNGIGLQEYLNFHKANTLGLQLVNILTKQLNGLISINRKFGTEFNIIFKELNYNKRI